MKQRTFKPQLDILPKAQRVLWPELEATPAHFTLYGGTALALRLGHRQSADFDFFTAKRFQPARLAASINYLKGCKLRQSSENTLTAEIRRGGPVQLSYFGALSLGIVLPPERVEGPGFNVASLLDIAGTKVAVVTQRAEPKDYIDIHALLTFKDMHLPTMLAAARVIYGPSFDPFLSLKAIAYHEDPALHALSPRVRRDLIAAVRSVDASRLPRLTAFRRRTKRS